MDSLSWIVILAVCLLCKVLPATAGYCYYSSYYSYYYCYSYYSSGGVIAGAVVGSIIAVFVIAVIIIVVCQKVKGGGRAGTVVQPTSTVTTIRTINPQPHQQPVGQQGMTYPPPMGNSAYPPPPVNSYGYGAPQPGGYGVPPTALQPGVYGVPPTASYGVPPPPY